MFDQIKGLVGKHLRALSLFLKDKKVYKILCCEPIVDGVKAADFRSRRTRSAG